MMSRRLIWMLAIAMCGSITCGTPTTPTPTPTPVVTPQPFVTIPEIHGVVREVDGGPIAGATVIKTAAVGPATETRSDANGGFMFATSLEPATVGLYGSFGSWGDQYVWGDGIPVSPSTDPTPVSVGITLQRLLTVSTAEALDTTLTANDLRFSHLAEGAKCGPCKVMVLKPSQGGSGIFDLRVQASSPGQLRLILVKTSLSYASDELIGQAVGLAGGADVTLRIDRDQLEMSPAFLPVLYVASAAGVPVSVRVTLIRVQ